MYTQNELQQLPRRTADEYRTLVRPALRSGDLLFASGSFFFSKLIKRASHSTWSHVAIIYRIPPPTDRVLVLESIEVHGVRLAPLSKYLDNYLNSAPYPGSVYIARYGEGISEDRFQQMLRLGCDLLTARYGYVDMASMTLSLLFGRRFMQRRDQYVCSELVEACFKRAGLTVKKTHPLISPEDFAQEPVVRFLHRLL